MKIAKRSQGFTLIELMIVVAIIGILAAIAIPNFVAFQLKSKTAEGKTNLAAIRTAEESYFAEIGTYVAAAVSPDLALSAAKRAYTANGTGFPTVGWSPEGQVYFNYAVAINGTSTQFTASAGADLDADNTPQNWGYSTDKATAAVNMGDGKGGQCAIATLTAAKVVGACVSTHGQSVF